MKYFNVFMDIDEQLINRNTETEEAEKAGEYRATQRGGVSENTGSLREQIQQKKKENIDAKKVTGKAATKKSIENPFLKMTDGLLKSAWENLIPSWGLTLFWIDIHVFLNKVLGPSAFRDLGEEWIPTSIKKIGKEKTKEAAALLGIVEKAGCGCLNLGCLLLVVAEIAQIALIVKIFTGNPLENIKAIFDLLWGIFS